MNCDEAQLLTNAYADGELDLIRAVEMEKHISTCGNCAREYQDLRSLRAALHAHDLRFTAPPGLKQQIQQTVLSADAPFEARPLWPANRRKESTANAPFPAWFYRLLNLGLPLACTAIVVLILIPIWRTGISRDYLTDELVSSHIRSLMVNHLTDVASSDQHTVKPWFNGRIDFAPPVINPADQGFPLLGGRLEYLQNRPVAALVYQRQKHFINLFVWPAKPAATTTPKAITRRGYNLSHWDHMGLTFWAVSDLNGGELGQFVAIIQASVPNGSRKAPPVAQ